MRRPHVAKMSQDARVRNGVVIGSSAIGAASAPANGFKRVESYRF